MAATGAQTWEVVSKPSKKAKAPAQVVNKNQKKAFIETMPKLAVNHPVKESSTIYDSFVYKHDKPQEKQPEKPERNGKNHGKPSSPSSKNQPQKRPKPPKAVVERKHKASSLEEFVKKVDVKELETVLAKDQATFPENPNIWLKDLVSVLNLQLDKVAEGDPVFHNKPMGFPASALPFRAKKLIVNTINQSPKKMHELFFEHCVQSMISDIGKGISTYGYKIFIQILVNENPDLVLSDLKKYVELMKENESKPLRCLSIMWTIGQAGKTKLSNGIKVWLEAFLPMMNVHALSFYVVEYLENLFREHKNVKQAYESLGFRNFFPLLDMIFASSSSLPTNLQKKLQGVYPKLKEISFGAEPSNNLRNFFPSFLVRLTPKATKQFKAELLDRLVECLSVDKQCFSVWRQIYTKEMTKSGILLDHIVHQWNKVSSKLDKNLLKETIRAFSITNEELASRSQKKDAGYSKCVNACKELLLKMSSPRFPWRTLFFIVFATIVGLLSYDAYQAGSFKKSKTAQLLKDAGLLVFLEQVWQRITVYSKKALVWLQDNVPHYYSKTCEFLGPYLTLFWEKLYELGLYVAEVSKPLREWLNQKVPLVLEWIQERIPWLTAAIGHYLSIAWSFIAHYSLLLFHHVANFIQITGTWLQENVFTGKLSGENIQRTLSSSLAVVQSYTSSAVQWIAQQFSSSPQQ